VSRTRKLPLLSLDGVGLRYPSGTRALADVTLSLEAGEFVSVVGPSGCGKSTLLRLAAGLLAPTRGTVVRHTDRVGYIFQDPTLLPWRSVRRNVELVGELTGLGRRDRQARAAQALGRVGLAEFSDQRPSALSVGMRMRASLARTLIIQPELFLLDEPFAAIDELTRARLCGDLQALFVADGFAGLFVTHSVAEAVFLSHRVLVMSGRPGRIVGQVEVPMPLPRTAHLRYTTEFAELSERVFTLLGQARPVTQDPVTKDPVTKDPVTKDPVTKDPVTQEVA
jgi:NitT/TauT family transport system ATP-binding protein